MPNAEALYISLGILGATVMPHNLYLHSSIVQTRAHDRSPEGLRQAIRFNTIDTVVALGAAFFVNAAILVLAAAAFHRQGHVVAELQDAHKLLTRLLGSTAPKAFAIALLASGQSSTITGTLAGQIVMEGFLRIRIAPWMRRLITRGLAIVPAILMIGATGGKNTMGLLILSQVVLSMQLSFAIFPLMMFTSDPKRMGEFANPLPLKIAGYLVCFIIAALNLYLLGQTAYEHFKISGLIGLGVLAVAGLLFAGWVRFFYQERHGSPANAG
jgi:manganese transport protein